MKILQVVQGFPPESVAGTELYCQALARALQEKGHCCLVLAGSMRQAEAPALVTTDEAGTQVTRFVSPLRLEWRERQIDPYSSAAELFIRQYLEGVRPDLIHVQHWLRLTNNIVSIASQLGIPAVVTLHDLWTTCARFHRLHRLGHLCQEAPSPSLCESCVERYPWQGDLEIRQALELRQAQIAEELRLAHYLLVPSEPHQHFLSTLLDVPTDRLRVIPHGSIVHFASQPEPGHPRFPQRPLRLVYWGYLVHCKGVHLLVEAIQQLQDRSAVEVILMGSTPDAGYYEYLQRLAEGLPVTFLGTYRPTDLVGLDVDLAVFPSLVPESYGFVLDEAFQLKLPVIVSDRGALPARVGDAGLVFSAGDAGALASRIQAILDTPSLLEDMRNRLSRFSSPSMLEHIQALEAIYVQVRQLGSHIMKGSDTVLSTASRRLACCQTALAARDEEMIHLTSDLQDYKAVSTRLEHNLRRQDETIAQLNRQVQEEVMKTRRFEDLAHEVSRSLGWRALQRYYYWRVHCLAPPGTRRGRLYDLLKRAGMAYLEGGLTRVVHKARKQFDQATSHDPYQLWLAQHTLTSEQIRHLRTEVDRLAYQPLISIVMPVYNAEETWLRQAIESVRQQIYSKWELCICDDGSTESHVSRILMEYSQQDERLRILTSPHNQGISSASNHALSLARGEFVGFVDHDDTLMPEAIYEVVKLLNDQPDLDLIYTDEDKLTVDGRRVEPFFKPDWSPDLLLSMNYITHFAVARRSILQAIDGFTVGLEGSQDYDLFLRISEKTQRVGHVAKPLYSWRKIPASTASDTQAKPYAHLAGRQALQSHLERRGIRGQVVDGLVTPFRYRIRYEIADQPLVSIVIPTKDRVELLKRCIGSIVAKTTYRRFEIIIVDNRSEEPETLSYLARLPYPVVSMPEPFNYSRMNNAGAATARGTFLLFLNNDIEIITEEWLEALLEQAQRREVGAVGAKLLFPNGTIQHAGVILGHGGFANHAFWGQPDDSPGYCCLTHVVRNYSAVTGACLMTRREVFHEVGGFDENLSVAFGDVDLCLRMREKGYTVISTPYAVLCHLESATRKKLHPMADEAYARKRWGWLLVRGDPYYNAHLTLERFDFSLRILDCGQASA